MFGFIFEKKPVKEVPKEDRLGTKEYFEKRYKKDIDQQKEELGDKFMFYPNKYVKKKVM